MYYGGVMNLTLSTTYYWDSNHSFYQWGPWGHTYIPNILMVWKPSILQHHNGTIQLTQFSVLTASAIGAYKLTPKSEEEELFLPY